MELRNEAFHLLRQLFQQHTARWQQALPDLTKPQYAVMRSIAEQPGIEQVTLTEAAVSTKATLAEMLSRMESRGLVRREQDPMDKRRRFVYLTAEGEALLANSIPLGNGVDEAFLDRLSKEERLLFSSLIQKMMTKEQMNACDQIDKKEKGPIT
ncbi:MarR family winged helix-turn-helix transcriptional regulator [Klebsiella indica]|uniref:MarR family transcriptional regulator n=2 Tax=Klebsiella TaxID=570 RepID=A0A5R9LM92_9ENTR|nr:MarR family transcriptional regulator [Klebsiella indica]TLV21996.1 MarR family transcriptional regulator [Klebsiella indica]